MGGGVRRRMSSKELGLSEESQGHLREGVGGKYFSEPFSLLFIGFWGLGRERDILPFSVVSLPFSKIARRRRSR